MPEPATLLVEQDGPITRIVLNRPEVLNALNQTMVAELRATLRAIRVDTGCRVVILTGEGRGFCAGLDLAGYGEVPGSEGIGPTAASMVVQQDIAGLLFDLRQVRQPVIAAVNGPATGGGLALVLTSDLRLAGASARFGVAFMRIGLSGCDIGTSWLLPRLVGVGRAHELMLTGRLFGAEEAATMGLVLETVPDTRLGQRAEELADTIVAVNSPLGSWMTKQTMWASLDAPTLAGAVELENRTQVLASTTADHREAMAAFGEQRPPNYTFT